MQHKEDLNDTLAVMATARTQVQPNIRAGEGLSQLPLDFWLLAIVSGVGAGLGGACLMLLLHGIQHLAWNYSAGDFLQAVERASPGRRWLVIVSIGVVVAGGRKLLRRAGGGHGGEVAASIWLHRARIPFWPAVAHAIFSIVTVALGSALGREGAPKSLGAAIASQLGRWRKLAPDQLRLMVACGAGGGVAAVYNVPLGGAVFACEVLLGDISLPLVVPALLVTLTATCVSWLALPNLSTYSTSTHSISFALVLGALAVGALAGAAAIIYIRLIAWADGLKISGWLSWVGPIVVFAALAVGATWFPQILGNGKDVVQLAFSGSLPAVLLFPLLLLRPLASASCLAIGSPGGLFTPTITVGALLGALIARVAGIWLGGVDASAWAILGAAAFLGACNKGPLSALLFAAELTGHLDGLVIPMMLAIALAVLTCQLFEKRSIYSARIHNAPARGRH
jgi:CIC family chloride channel protein